MPCVRSAKNITSCHARQQVTGTMARFLETVLLSLRKILVFEDHREPTYKCPSSDLSPGNFRGLCILQTQYDNYDYDAPESRWRRQGTLATSQIEEGICWFARTVWENLLYFSYLSTSGTRFQHKWIIHAATQCRRGSSTMAWATSY